MVWKVLITDSMVDDVVDFLSSREDIDLSYRPDIVPEDLRENIGDFDAVIVRSRTKLTRDILEKAENLKVVGRAGIGVDNIDVDYCTERNIYVVNAPRSSTISVAELAMGLMLSLARKIPAASNHVRSKEWKRKAFMGTELDGKTLGILGAGRIGQALAERAQAFGMRTIGYDPYLPPEVAREKNIDLVDLETLFRESDFLSIHTVLTDETRGMVNMEKLKLMKATSYIINCSRGPVINESDLAEAIQSGVIAGAGLDVYETEPPSSSPLLSLPEDKMVFTPHIGASTKEGQIKAGMTSAEQVLKVLNGEAPDFWVNRW